MGSGTNMNGAQRCRKLARLMRRHKNCYYCGCVLNKANRSIDHLIPQALGGPNHIDNLVLCCLDCNQRKGAVPVLPAPWVPPNGVAREWSRMFSEMAHFCDLATRQFIGPEGKPLRWQQLAPLSDTPVTGSVRPSRPGVRKDQ
nr:HNH endonuclease [Flagellatimonas centrodinii]